MDSGIYSTSSLLIQRTPWWKLPRLKRWFDKVTFHLGGIGIMSIQLLRDVRKRWEMGEIFRQMDSSGSSRLRSRT